MHSKCPDLVTLQTAFKPLNARLLPTTVLLSYTCTSCFRARFLCYIDRTCFASSAATSLQLCPSLRLHPLQALLRGQSPTFSLSPTPLTTSACWPTPTWTSLCCLLEGASSANAKRLARRSKGPDTPQATLGHHLVETVAPRTASIEPTSCSSRAAGQRRILQPVSPFLTRLQSSGEVLAGQLVLWSKSRRVRPRTWIQMFAVSHLPNDSLVTPD
jgi:hypothetical protein